MAEGSEEAERAVPRVHRYEASTSWTGSTAGGYRAYSRAHVGSVGGLAEPLELSADPVFRGDASHLNPEQLLVLSASSCQLLSFLALGARSGIEVTAYRDVAHATMTESGASSRLDRIVLRPEIRVAAGTDLDRVAELVEQAHRECYVANSLTTEVEVAATLIAGGAPTRAPTARPSGLRPERLPGEFVVVTTTDPMPEVRAFARLAEAEGETLVVARAEADRHALAYRFVGALISLRAETSLDEIGVTAAIATRLSAAGIACNVFAGYHHDHLLVPVARARDALEAIEHLELGAWRRPPS